VKYPFVPDGGNTEEGFTQVYDSIHQPIVDTVNELSESGEFKTLFVTGHSLGAALATLAIPELIENTAFSQPIMYNFASSPRVGDEMFKNLIETSLRVFNTRDEVPMLPPRFLEYIHVKTNTAITFGKPIRNLLDFERIEDNHIMCNYNNALCKMTNDPESCKKMAGGADGCNT
jgi:predicted lipase